jgi:hypothetical protein
MDEQEKAAAKELAGRGVRQARHAAKNTAKATAYAADAIGDDIQEGAEKVVEAGKRINPKALTFISSETGMGFLALALGVGAFAFAGRRFSGAIAARKQVVK